jgi:hypothetical protein
VGEGRRSTCATVPHRVGGGTSYRAVQGGTDAGREQALRQTRRLPAATVVTSKIGCVRGVAPKVDQVGGIEGLPAALLASLPFFIMSDCLPVCAEMGRSSEVSRRRSHDLQKDDASPTMQGVRAAAHTTPRRLTNTGASCLAPEGDTRSPTRSAAEHEKGNR